MFLNLPAFPKRLENIETFLTSEYLLIPNLEKYTYYVTHR